MINQDKTVDLRWETTSEKNVDHFEIEKSRVNGLFTSIAQVKAVGNADVINQYTYHDAIPYHDMNYYRLKIMDEDGQFTYSNVINLMINQSKTQ